MSRDLPAAPARRRLLAAFALAAFAGRRAAAAPAGAVIASSDPNWTRFSRVKVKADYEKGVFTAVFPPDILALNGKPLVITGYVLPIAVTDVGARTDHLILSRYSPLCPFCPPGEPNEHVEIRLERPIPLTPALLKFAGVLKLQDDGVQGLFLGLNNARVVP